MGGDLPRQEEDCMKEKKKKREIRENERKRRG